MFRRDTGYSTAYIGSSNLSKAALVDGVEWNVRLSQVGSPDILEKFDATFNTYWESPEYEAYDPERDRQRFDRAVAPEQGETSDDPIYFLDLEPWPHQREMLEKLAVERERHARQEPRRRGHRHGVGGHLRRNGRFWGVPCRGGLRRGRRWGRVGGFQGAVLET